MDTTLGRASQTSGTGQDGPGAFERQARDAADAGRIDREDTAANPRASCTADRAAAGASLLALAEEDGGDGQALPGREARPRRAPVFCWP
jgi:hypothetical protein